MQHQGIFDENPDGDTGARKMSPKRKQKEGEPSNLSEPNSDSEIMVYREAVDKQSSVTMFKQQIVDPEITYYIQSC